MSVADGASGRPGKANRRTPGMHVDGKSDGSVIPTKQPNNADGLVAEAVEGRDSIRGTRASKTRPGHRAGPMRSVRLNVYARLQRRIRRDGSRRCCTT
jgi:RNA-directed DNA polymerase